MNFIARIRAALFGLAFLMQACGALAQDTSGDIAGVACPDAGLFSQGGLVSKVCTTCYFPIYIGDSLPIGGNTQRKPDDDPSSGTCICPGRIFGYPTPGVKLGMWQPTHMIEVVRQPYCSPALGSRISGSTSSSTFAIAKQGGNGVTSPDHEQHTPSYYNFHYWKFPLSVLTDMVTDTVCVAESGGGDMDLAYVSEIDPTWNSDTLAMYTHPEAVLFSNPIAIASCMADAAASTLYKPIPMMFWCHGAHGHAYPFTGHNNVSDPANSTSSAASRALAALHRRGIAKQTYGTWAVCRDHPNPTLPRQQYRLQAMFPIPELPNNHWLGAHPSSWAGGQFNLPGVGEDFLYLVWSWQTCCMNF
jgi:conjugal transfer pilus assembly protein TraU